MGNIRLGRSHRGLGVFINMYMLVSITLVGCGGKLIVLTFMLRLARRYFFKFNVSLRILNVYLSSSRLLIGTNLGVL